MSHENNSTKDLNNTGKEIYSQIMSKPKKHQSEILPGAVVIVVVMHLVALYGLYLGCTSAKLKTILFAIVTYYLACFGITAGSHRLWSHRAYKATWQLKWILLFCQTLAFQFSVISWARTHRRHHKFSDTDLDPHNAKRGFFYAHIGWLMCKRSQKSREMGKMDVSDLYAEPLLRWQHKYIFVLMPCVCLLIPTILPLLLWDETLVNAFCVNVSRWVTQLHVTFLVNSAAHLWGYKPYDKNIYPSNNPIVSLFALGEGWHNYHHIFPWDYRTSEFGRINPTLKLINFFAKIGWAYDLKTASEHAIKARVERTGDGSHEIWCRRDKDQLQEEYKS